jgi:HJR/Mrr/RecB family endonuclease
MNQNLDKAIQGVARVGALMYAYEKAFLDLEVEPEERERADMAISTFYAIWDTVREVAEDLERLDGDCLVVDAIYAVNNVRHKRSSLKTGE